MRQGAVDFLSHVQFWCYVVTICVEFIMMFVPVFVNKAYFERYKKKEIDNKTHENDKGLISSRIEMSAPNSGRQVNLPPVNTIKPMH